MALLHPSSSSSSSSVEPLTIFYSGTVNVFPDVPPSKARAVMLLLLNSPSSTPPPPPPDAVPPPHHHHSTTSPAASAALSAIPSPPALPLSIAATNLPPDRSPASPLLLQPPRKRSESDLPFARKASLARFLERRRGRVENNLNQEAVAAAAAASTVEQGNDVGDPALGDVWNQPKKIKLG